MLIREEKTEDYKDVYSVVKNAFKKAQHSDGNEQNLVNELRESKAFIPELSLVCEISGKVVGHIMFTKAFIGEYEVLALAPLSVLPEYQNKGVGATLIKEGHNIAKKLGFDYAIVLGDNVYYNKFGYVPASEFGIEAPFPVDNENFMAIKLNDLAPEISGTIKYAKEFGI